jgi:Fur family transcriptional regulator, ferric uptake regulator
VSDQQPQAVLDLVAARLHSRGERMTGPRRAVVTALARQDGHLSAEQVVEAVGRIDAGVHRASVYRSLEALSGLGVVQHVHVGHGATAYHLIDQTGAHLHAQCRECGAVVDLPADLLDPVARRLAREDGFVLEAEHVALSGLCADCAARAARDRPEG